METPGSLDKKVKLSDTAQNGVYSEKTQGGRYQSLCFVKKGALVVSYNNTLMEKRQQFSRFLTPLKKWAGGALQRCMDSWPLHSPLTLSESAQADSSGAIFLAQNIKADHKDLIHDVSFDFHGRRMATCSSDQSVKVWDKSESGDWHCTASWKAHNGTVYHVTWAHPEFGQVLASCSFDRTAAVWEDIVEESNKKRQGQSHWLKRTILVDSRTSITDVKFAPKHMGLMLATCSADGIVRIYEAPDVMNLNQWSLQHEISFKLSCSCISWNPSVSRAHSPMIAVGSNDPSPKAMAKVQIFEYNENTRKYAKAETLMAVTVPVHDIAFAPNMGRSFHILAIATKDVRIITLKPVRKELSSAGPTKFEIHIVAQLDNHNSQVWRVSWNITGTVLASSGDDGCVRLWKANYMDNWKCTGILKHHGSPVNGGCQLGNSNAH